MKKKLHLSFGLFIGLILTTQQISSQIVSHSASQVVTEQAVACENDEFGFTFDNSYWRSYILSNFGFTDTQALTGIQFGYVYVDFDGNAPDIDVTIRAYTTDAVFPTGNLTQIASGIVSINEAGSFTLINALFDTPVNIDENEEVVLEVFFPDTFNDLVQIRVGQNQEAETAPSYFSTAECGGIDITTFEAVGFPGSAIINMSVDSPLSVDELSLSSITVLPNPVDHILNITFPNNVEIESAVLYNVIGEKVLSSSINRIDVSQLPQGVYFLNLKTNAGVIVRKIVKS